MKVFSKESSFKHFEGDNRKYIMVAVVENLKDSKDGEPLANLCVVGGKINGKRDVESTKDWRITKTLSFGIAICHPNDKYDFEVGKKIAIEKALRNNEIRRCIAFSHHGLIDDYMIKYLLAREAQAFENNPGAFITNYTEDKLAAEHQVVLDNFKKNMTVDQKIFVSVLQRETNENRNLLQEVALG